MTNLNIIETFWLQFTFCHENQLFDQVEHENFINVHNQIHMVADRTKTESENTKQDRNVQNRITKPKTESQSAKQNHITQNRITKPKTESKNPKQTCKTQNRITKSKTESKNPKQNHKPQNRKNRKQNHKTGNHNINQKPYLLSKFLSDWVYHFSLKRNEVKQCLLFLRDFVVMSLWSFRLVHLYVLAV